MIQDTFMLVADFKFHWRGIINIFSPPASLLLHLKNCMKLLLCRERENK